MKLRRLWAPLAATLALASPAEAQSNYRLSPVGGRSLLLGGTGVVYGRDASAGFLNPATAVLADDSRLSFSVNFYSISFVYAPRWYAPGPIDRARFPDLDPGERKMTDLEFNALPSSLCIMFKVMSAYDARLGFCLASVQNQSFNFAAEGYQAERGPNVTRQAQTLSQSYNRFTAGPTFAMNVNESLALGASFHGSLASHRSLLASAATTYGSVAPINSTFYGGSRGDSFQLSAIVGATYRLGKQKFGLSVESPSLHIYGTGGANQHYHFEGSGNETRVVTAQGSFSSRSPMRISAGTGLEAGWGTAEVNVSYHTALGGAYSASLEGHDVMIRDGALTDDLLKLDLAESARGVVNVGVGAELNVSSKVSLLTGASTDFSAVSKGGLRGSYFNYFPSRTNRLAGSLGISSHGAGGELIGGAEFSVGWGERLAVNSYQLPPEIGTTGHGTYQVLFVIAGSTSLQTIKRAVEDLTKVITDPKTPANDQKKK